MKKVIRAWAEKGRKVPELNNGAESMINDYTRCERQFKDVCSVQMVNPAPQCEDRNAFMDKFGFNRNVWRVTSLTSGRRYDMLCANDAVIAGDIVWGHIFARPEYEHVFIFEQLVSRDKMKTILGDYYILARAEAYAGLDMVFTRANRHAHSDAEFVRGYRCFCPLWQVAVLSPGGEDDGARLYLYEGGFEEKLGREEAVTGDD